MNSNNRVCVGCSATAAQSQCARCDIPYCGRECQVTHWPEHRKTCTPSAAYKNKPSTEASRQKLIDQFFSNVCKVIAGNVIILNAWYRQTYGCVEIEITENVLDFSQSGTHFLHMNYVDLPDTSDCKYSDPSKCFIKFKLADYLYESYIIIKLPASLVKSKQPQPSREWTLMYEV